MKARLEFDLPQEQQEYEAAQKAPKYIHAMYAIVNELRRIRKYTEDFTPELEKHEKFVWEILSDCGIDPYED